MRKYTLLVPCIILISACGANVDDLIAYTNEVKQTTQVSIEEYPQFNTLEPMQYAAQELRSPFARTNIQNNETSPIANTSNCLQPKRNRQKGTLESYGIDALRMAGVMSIGGSQYALIKANDGTLHRVKRGQYLGLFNGKVESISSTKIIIQEMLPDGAGCWKTKQATLTMSSVTGENDNV